jgi:hypothetical protein
MREPAAGYSTPMWLNWYREHKPSADLNIGLHHRSLSTSYTHPLWDGRIFKSIDAGAIWNAADAGLVTLSIYALAVIRPSQPRCMPEHSAECIRRATAGRVGT